MPPPASTEGEEGEGGEERESREVLRWVDECEGEAKAEEKEFWGELLVGVR
jgi:hypothetical protein